MSTSWRDDEDSDRTHPRSAPDEDHRGGMHTVGNHPDRPDLASAYRQLAGGRTTRQLPAAATSDHDFMEITGYFRSTS
jgi:hypothetical protein